MSSRDICSAQFLSLLDTQLYKAFRRQETISLFFIFFSSLLASSTFAVYRFRLYGLEVMSSVCATFLRFRGCSLLPLGNGTNCWKVTASSRQLFWLLSAMSVTLLWLGMLSTMSLAAVTTVACTWSSNYHPYTTCTWMSWKYAVKLQQWNTTYKLGEV